MAKNRVKQRSKGPAPATGNDDSRVLALDRGILIPLALALVLFVGAILVFPFPASVHDAYSYEMTALRLIQDHVYAYSGALPGTPVVPNANVTPGLVLFLASIFVPVAGSAPTAGAASTAIEPWLVGFQFVMALGIVLAITVAGRLLGGRRLGLLAGILGACYLPFAWASTVALNEQLGTLLFSWQICLGLYLVDTRAKRGYGVLFGYGVLTALTLMLRPALVVWAPVPLLYIAIRRSASPRQSMGFVLAATAGLVLIFSPWWIRNQSVVGHFELLRTDTTIAETVTPVPHDAGPESNGVGPQFPDVTKAQADRILAVVARQGSAGTTQLDKTKESLLTPWVPQLAVTWEDIAHPDQSRFGYAEPATYSLRNLIELAEIMRFYQWFLLVAAGASVLALRRLPQIAVVIAVPVLVVVAHYATQMSARYLYPAMPAVVVLAGCGLYALWSLAEKARHA